MESRHESKALENLQAERSYKTGSLAISQIKESISNAELLSKSTEIITEDLRLMERFFYQFIQVLKR